MYFDFTLLKGSVTKYCITRRSLRGQQFGKCVLELHAHIYNLNLEKPDEH